MQKILLLFLSFLLFAFHSTEHKTKNDWAEQNLKGKVKSISENEYNAVQKSHKIKKGASTGSESYVFNEMGNMTEQNIYNPDGTLFSNFTCTYDGNGNKIEQNRFTNGVLFRKSTFTFDENGNIIEELMYINRRENYFENSLTSMMAMGILLKRMLTNRTKVLPRNLLTSTMVLAIRLRKTGILQMEALLTDPL